LLKPKRSKRKKNGRERSRRKSEERSKIKKLLAKRLSNSSLLRRGPWKWLLPRCRQNMKKSNVQRNFSSSKH